MKTKLFRFNDGTYSFSESVSFYLMENYYFLNIKYLKFKGKKIETITDVESCQNGTTNFIHLGGLKTQMKRNHNAKEHFNLACANRLTLSFPEYLDKFKQINCLKKYF